MVLIKFSSSCIINGCILSTKKYSVRCFSFNSVKGALTNIFQSKPLTPPYDHVCQVGDPVLRMKATPVDLKIIKTHEFQTILQKLSKIINPTQVIHHESCGSITGFGASVSRAKEVEVKAFNQLGDTFSWQAKGLAARIIQHEYDHLQGKLYIDRMDPSTFECPIWELINVKNDISEEEPLAGSMRTVFLLDRLRKSP
ncbi:peptide deformylase, mitochondrial isoform X2 [Nomia melanderi]|uniref:peptide deformylase, mitochondrial isoform X2 n=1 Tax=Nomia melanderi TaxID=2448451 RepID=UPI0013044978|nr:peptide deformylase, mitochondrial-like isoform X2 [Nomia melanderi]